MSIIPAVSQVFVNHFILGMKPLDAVLRPRIYTKVLTLMYLNSFFIYDAPNFYLIVIFISCS
jgi:gamma-glutamyltranspeptidase